MNRGKRAFFWLLFLAACAAAALVGAILVAPYAQPDLPQLPADYDRWTTLIEQNAGYVVDYPDAYTVQRADDGRSIMFCYRGSPLVMITYSTREQAAARGLWADHRPVEQTYLGGRLCEKYVYDHFDAIFGLKTISYVVSLRDRFLAMDFRVRRASMLESLGIRPRAQPALGSHDQRMLQSLQFLDE